MMHLYVEVSECDEYPYSFEFGGKAHVSFYKDWIYCPISVLAGARCFVLEGRERVRILEEHGVKHVSALCFEGLSEAEQLVSAALHRQCTWPLNLIEKSRLIVHLRDSFGFDTQHLVEILRQLGENPSVYILESLYRLKDLVVALQDYVVRVPIRLKTALRLCQYSTQDQESVYACCKVLKLNVNETHIFLEGLDVLCQRDSASLTEVLASIPSLNATDPSMSPQTRRSKALQELHALQYPRYSAHFQALQTHISSFRLQPHWRIIVAKHLEAEGFDLHFRIRNHEEYLHALARLMELDRDHSIQKLFTLL